MGCLKRGLVLAVAPKVFICFPKGLFRCDEIEKKFHHWCVKMCSLAIGRQVQVVKCFGLNQKGFGVTSRFYCPKRQKRVCSSEKKNSSKLRQRVVENKPDTRNFRLWYMGLILFWYSWKTAGFSRTASINLVFRINRTLDFRDRKIRRST